MMKKLILASAMAVWSVVAFGQSPEQQAARQCRSVHLAYDAPAAQVISLGAMPITSAHGTYFCLIGFNAGYCGIQELANGQRVVLFSVWDPGDPFDFSKHPDEVDEAMRTKVLYEGEGVNVSRFGGEGTGGKSIMPYAWNVGSPVFMAVTAHPYGDHRTAYTGWIWQPEKQTWFRMATFATLVSGAKGALTGAYSFVEDFRRNVRSKEDVRQAYFTMPWTTKDGVTWQHAKRAKFTADNNLLMNIDAMPENGGLVLVTGGKTVNQKTKLNGILAPLDAATYESTTTPPAELTRLMEQLKTLKLNP